MQRKKENNTLVWLKMNTCTEMDLEKVITSRAEQNIHMCARILLFYLLQMKRSNKEKTLILVEIIYTYVSMQNKSLRKGSETLRNTIQQIKTFYIFVLHRLGF